MGQTATATHQDTLRGCDALARPRYELIPISGMMEQARTLPTGATITVTCSPKHGIGTTLDAAETLATQGYDAVPHVAARLIRDHGELREILDRLSGAGLREAFIVGGDAAEAAGPFRGGLELLRAIHDSGRRPPRIGVPAYPEPHASIPGKEMQTAFLAKGALADYAVTQICFDANAILGWLVQQRELGMDLPVYVGLPGVIDRTRLLGLAVRIGLGASTRVLRRQGGLASRLFGSSVYQPDDLVRTLAPAFDTPQAPGLAGFHVNTFNQVEATRRWMEETAEELRQWSAPRPEKAAGLTGAVEGSY